MPGTKGQATRHDVGEQLVIRNHFHVVVPYTITDDGTDFDHLHEHVSDWHDIDGTALSDHPPHMSVPAVEELHTAEWIAAGSARYVDQWTEREESCS